MSASCLGSGGAVGACGVTFFYAYAISALGCVLLVVASTAATGSD